MLQPVVLYPPVYHPTLSGCVLGFVILVFMIASILAFVAKLVGIGFIMLGCSVFFGVIGIGICFRNHRQKPYSEISTGDP